MKDLLSRAATVAEQAELFQYNAERQAVSFESSKLKEITSTEEQSTTLRLIREGRLGSSTVTKPHSEDILLKYASNTLQYGSSVGYKFPGAARLAQPSVYDARVTRVTQQEMLDMASDLVSALHAYDPNIKAMAEVAKQRGTYALSNSAGFSAECEYTTWLLVFGGELVSERDGFLFVQDYIAGTDYEGKTDLLKSRVIESFRLARNIATIKPGQYPVIFAPSEVGSVVSPLLACLNGRAVARGFSPFKDRLGELGFDPRLSIIDDATASGAVGSKSFDREGTPTGKRALIDRGTIASYLLDLQTAAELNLVPTGNGSTGGPVPNNIIIPGGSSSFDEMLAGIDEGVLIEGTMGAWAGNPYGGQVSGNISLGYKIEKGRLVGRVKDCMFSVNAFTDLRDNISALSREQIWRGNTCYPYLALQDVNISAKV
ncbi:MAG: Metalloprotease TldD [Firmicutes bacterium]|nr:Metalloprotease TldD [Bacillota bacterium]